MNQRNCFGSRIVFLVVLALFCFPLALLAQVQSFPTRQVTVIVGAGAGGSMGLVARQLAQELEKKWNKPVVVDFKPGAGGFIAAQYVGRATPDGYTLLFSENGLTTVSLFTKSIVLNPAKDIEPVTMIISQPYMIVTSAKLPARNLVEFIALAKATPGKLNFGGLGRSGQTLEILRFSKLAGIQMEEIAYKSAPEATHALITNDLQLYMSGYNTMLAQIKAGTVVPLALMGDKRLAQLPDLATAKESGIDQTSSFWYGLWAPPGTPRELLSTISADVRDALLNTPLKARLEEQVFTVIGNTPEEFTKVIEADMRVNAESAKAANIIPQ
jgi:tripartite-type tricarboxylate transporter receptor subunit TctC